MLHNQILYSMLLFSGVSNSRFRNIRNRYNCQDLIDIHHIIPRKFRNHPTILMSEYNIDNGYNLCFLPTNKGRVVLNNHIDRPIHYNGHPGYNEYVEKSLDNMFMDGQVTEENMCRLIVLLRENMRHCHIPFY